MRIYVGNLSYDTSEDDLRAAFEAHGQVDSVSIISDQYSGRPKGFGFVEMPNDEEAKKAMENLNEKDLGGRPIKVNEARSRSGGGGNRGGGFRRSF